MQATCTEWYPKFLLVAVTPQVVVEEAAFGVLVEVSGSDEIGVNVDSLGSSMLVPRAW